MIQFAVFPDPALDLADPPASASRPSALFSDLEDAITWAVGRYGGGRFTIRHLQVMEAQRDDGPRRGTCRTLGSA